jgi:hypothetical protein
VQHAVQFHQFTVEEEQRQLVLKVTSCTLLNKAAATSTSAMQSNTAAEDAGGVDEHEALAAGKQGTVRTF